MYAEGASGEIFIKITKERKLLPMRQLREYKRLLLN